MASATYRVCDAVLRDRRFGTSPVEEAQEAEEEGFDLSFLGKNPPDHTRLRRLAAPLPIAVITDLLGIPDADSAAFSRYGAIIGSALGGVRSLRHAAQLAASEDTLVRLFESLFESLFELRRREPRDDIVGHLLTATEEEIRSAEMLSMCVLLLVAGFETTVNLIGNSVLALLDHPAQWRALCADPDGMAPRAVEETLRFDPPVQLAIRFALEPVELEGKTLGAGSTVNVLIGGANRDPDVYRKPGTFDLNRASQVGNLAFSSGIHYCLGQPLARLEATIALRMLAERMPNLSRAGAIRRRTGIIIRGPLRLPVTTGGRSRPAGVVARGPAVGRD